MGDITLILDRKESVVRMEANAVRIDRPGCRPQRAPLSMLDKVVVFGNPMVGCDVWRALSQNGIPALLFPIRGKGDAAYVGSGLSSFVQSRLEQYAASQDKDRRVIIARWLLDEKLSGQATMLQNVGGKSPKLKTAIEQINRHRADLHARNSIQELMGLEGAAAACYFKILAETFEDKWNFTGRNKRPPRDPVNALLSYGYTLATTPIHRLALAEGLDPAVGFLHSTKNGRDSLILDILEPIRPNVDWFVSQILASKLSPKHFSSNPQDGCRLTKEGRVIFFKAWAQWSSYDWEELEIEQRIKAVIMSLIVRIGVDR